MDKMDSFVSFLVGMCVGGCLGVIIAGFMAVISQTEERAEKEHERMMKGDHYHGETD